MDPLNNQEANKAHKNVGFVVILRPGLMAAWRTHGLALGIQTPSKYNQNCVRACMCLCVRV